MDSFPQRGPPTADHHSRGFISPPPPESIGSNHRMVPEEDVVFRLLCPADKIGSLIGKGGSIIRVIQNESGASIKIGDALAHDSDERVVVISAREVCKMILLVSPCSIFVGYVKSNFNW